VQSFDDRAWSELLEPVYVISTTEQIEIVLVTTESADALINWRIEEEGGFVHSGELPLSRLHIKASKEIQDEIRIKCVLPLPAYLAQGYHTLQLDISGGENPSSSTTTIVITPPLCYGVEDACPKHKPWGVAAQLYSLHNDRTWGMGSYSDIGELAVASAKQGASLLGLNPLHSTFVNPPNHISPYSPTSRSFLHVGYIDVTAVAEFDTCEAVKTLIASDDFKQRLATAREAESVDYGAVWDCRLTALKLLHAEFIKQHRDADTERAADYQQFCQDGGESLRRHVLFDALFTHFRELDSNNFGWTSWPREYQDANSATVAEFADKNTEQLDFWRYLQWIAHLQMSGAADMTKTAGMGIGLYLDLAVGCDSNGADVWADSECFVQGISVGAPPDKLSPAGQVWGLSPYNPIALRRNAYRPFIQAIRASTQYAGALRIDHVLGLLRQFWVLEGEHANQGVYVHQPLDELLKIIALESHRAKCVIIGEALGTVPEGTEERLAEAGMLSYKVLYFERWPDGLFKRGDTYPASSLVTVSTHDLPPLAGWWQARELDHMAALGHFSSQAAEQHERDQRAEDKGRLLAALVDAGTLPHDHGIDPHSAQLDDRVLVAAQSFLADTPSQLLAVPLEDLLGLDAQVNLPGTVNEHPNWRQRLPCEIYQLFESDISQRQLDAIRARRPNNA